MNNKVATNNLTMQLVHSVYVALSNVDRSENVPCLVSPVWFHHE